MSYIGYKTTNIYKRNPVCNVFYILSGFNDILESGCYESTLGYNTDSWFVDEISTSKKEMNFFFLNTDEKIIMSEKDEQQYRKKTIVDFAELKKFRISLEIIVT